MTAQSTNQVLRTILSALAKGNLAPLDEIDAETRLEQTQFAIKRGLIAADGAFRRIAPSAGIDLNTYHITPVGKMWLKKLSDEAAD